MKTLPKGTKLTGKYGNIYTVDCLISNGTGQGDIYKVYNRTKEKFALKLYHSGNKRRNEAQIARLIKRGQATECYVSPIEQVEYDGQVGYVMEFVDESFISAAALFNGIEDNNGRMIELPWSVKLWLLCEIMESLSVLSNASLGIYDIKFDNIRINPDSLQVKILDNDTIVYTKDKPMVLGTIGFMPPLTMIGKEKPNEYNDPYACAVIVFMSLIGMHPLEGKRREQPCNENIDRYLFGTHPVYAFHPTDNSNRPIAKDSRGNNQQHAIERMKRYPDYFKQAMCRTFVDGLFDGAKRTSIGEWVDILERLYNDSYICEQCGEEYFFDGNEKVCTICNKELLRPVFLEGDKRVPLFNDITIFSDDVFATTNHYDLFKVVETKYDGRFGLQNLTADKAVLRLPNGLGKSFDRNDVIPIFLDGEIEIEHKKIHFM